eukprot:gnl/Dysnectes_brevis/6110_a9216_298.p1 GENE.gnl/Dysnectes_brevis/6110_a9216_298~~gnl/Dysnectes_brevis/6110_a9216_298.p1  ORF type:complete len:358 (-),score=57.80 gnl/Dysnectes_brevis/6110_a9216_298:88-1161(-)
MAFSKKAQADLHNALIEYFTNIGFTSTADSLRSEATHTLDTPTFNFEERWSTSIRTILKLKRVESELSRLKDGAASPMSLWKLGKHRSILNSLPINMLTCSNDQVFAAQSSTILQLPGQTTLQGHTTPLTMLTASGNSMYSSDTAGTTRHWDISLGRSTASLRFEARAGEAFPDGGAVLTDGDALMSVNSTLQASSRQPLNRPWAPSTHLTSVGKHVLLGDNEGGLRLYDRPSLEESWASSTPTRCALTVLSGAEDGVTFGSADRGGSVMLWSSRVSSPTLSLPKHSAWVCGMCLTTSGVITAADDGVIRCFDLRQPSRPLRTVELGPRSGALCLARGRGQVFVGASDGVWAIDLEK